MTAMQNQGAPPAYGYPPLAGWGSRVGAYLIDSIIATVPYFIFLVIGAIVGGGARVALIVIGALIGLGIQIYNRWIMAGRTGQSWGRSALGIRLISEQTGQPIGGGMAFVRDLAHFVDSLICYIGWLFPLWDSKKQTIADKMVSTLVIKA
jgi:uncharacterized RDD family membrane protein YckC